MWFIRVCDALASESVSLVCSGNTIPNEYVSAVHPLVKSEESLSVGDRARHGFGGPVSHAKESAHFAFQLL